VANSKGTLGVVLRNESGDFLGPAAHFYPSMCDATMAEALACLQAVQLASELGVSKVILETDSLEVQKMVADEEVNRSMYEAIVQGFKHWLSLFQDFRIKWTVGWPIWLPIL
jgi:ribonuclease HI